MGTQRTINLMWETTQAVIAVAIVSANVYAVLSGVNSELLGNAFFLIVGFYFGRTNHHRPGAPPALTGRP
jgi:hypothetical protein